MIFFVAFIVRVDGHRSIAQDGLRTDGCHRNKFIRILEHIFEVIQRGFFFAVFHFEVGDGGLEARRPVDQTGTAIDESLFVEAHKRLSDCPAQPLVQGEAFAAPVTGGAEAPDLIRDHAAVFLLPFPGALDEFLAPELFARHFLVFEQVAFHHELCGNAGVIGARNPERGNALHAVIADHQIFDD